MARKPQDSQEAPSKARRGGVRPGAGRKAVLTEDQMIIVGGKCQELWKAAEKRLAKMRHEAAIADIGDLKSLHSSALSVVRGPARRDRGLVKLNTAVEDGEISASMAAGINAMPDVQKREILASILIRLSPIAADIDAEMESVGGRYQSLRLKQPKGERGRIIDGVVAWALDEHGWVLSKRRVRECWTYFRQIERQVLADLDR